MLPSAGDLRRQMALGPEEQIALLLSACFVGIVALLHVVLLAKFQLAFVFAAAVVGLLISFVGGTRVCLPIYYATTFGEAIRFPFLPSALSINRMAALLLFASIVFEIPFYRRRFPLIASSIVWIAFQVYYLSVAVVKKPPSAPYPVESFFYIVVALLIAGRYWQEKWLRWLLASMVPVMLATIVLPGLAEMVLHRDLKVDGLGGAITRINGLSRNSIIFAFIAIWSIPPTLTLFVEARNALAKLFFGGSAFLALLVALATGNRQTPIIFGVVLIVHLYFMRYRHKRLLVGLVVAGGLVLAPFFAAKIIDRFGTATSIQKDISLTVRHDKMEIAKLAIADNPWTGLGHTYFTYRARDYFPKGRLYLFQYLWDPKFYVDFGYLQIVTEYGLIGAAFFLVLMGTTFYNFRDAYRWSLASEDTWNTNVLAAVAALLAQLIVSLLIQDTFVTPRTYILFGIFWAAYTAARLHHRQRLEAAPAEALAA